MIDESTQDILINHGFTCEPCGSQITLDPPPGDKSDHDFLCVFVGNLVKKKRFPESALSDLFEVLQSSDWLHEGGEHYQQQAAQGFMSLRRGKINLIITVNQFWAERHRAATAICKLLNLAEKKHRILIFQAALYNNIMKPEMKLEIKKLAVSGEELQTAIGNHKITYGKEISSAIDSGKVTF